MPRTVAVVFATAALALLQAGCAASPAASGPAAPAARVLPATPGEQRSPLAFDLAGGSPMLDIGGEDGDALLATRLDFGLDDDLLRYRATYRLEAGDVFSFADDPAAAGATPSILAGQHFGQDVVLRLPELAGAPLSFGLTAEVQDRWQLAGEAQTGQERAQVEWSPWGATVRVQWSDRGQEFDPSLALQCNVESSLGLPFFTQDQHGPELRVSGRDCVVADGTAYAGLPVRTWGLGWSWSGAARQSTARVRVIEPAWSAGSLIAESDPGYQLGLSHRRDFGALSAAALVAVRQSPALLADGRGPGPATRWSTNASLTWHLADASVSADWAQGIDPLWFTPEAPATQDRFGLALDLSRWIENVAPGAASPALGMRWNWSERQGPGAGAVDENSLELNVSLLF